MLLLVASNAQESSPDRAGIVRKELAFKFALVVSFRSPYRLFNTVYRCVCVRNVILHHFRYKELK